jgi:integrase
LLPDEGHLHRRLFGPMLRRILALRELFPDREAEIYLALNTGLRWTEQYTLRCDHVVSTNQITLLSTKSDGEQHVPINANARAAFAKLRALHPQSKLVFPDGTDYTDHNRNFWKRVIARAKITDLGWHDLRHTFANRLVMAGVDIFTVSKLQRHGNVTTSQRHAHLSRPHRAAAIEKLAGARSVTESRQVPETQQYLQ